MTGTLVHPLLLAEVNLAGQYNPPTYQDGRIPVYAFLILVGNDVVLVDTGVGEGNAYVDVQFAPERRDLETALAEYGVGVADVTMLINSHLHFDHCGNNRLFPQVPVYVQAAELAAARGPRYTISEWFDHDEADLRPVDGSRSLLPGVGLIESPGHTPGHQSVLVETDEQTVLIAAQAAFTAAEFARGGDPEVQAHEQMEGEYVDSIVRLTALEAGRHLFSHDSSV